MSERKRGKPSSDIERIMRHYNCSWTEARIRLLTGNYELPPRGTGLKEGRARR